MSFYLDKQEDAVMGLDTNLPSEEFCPKCGTYLGYDDSLPIECVNHGDEDEH